MNAHQLNWMLKQIQMMSMSLGGSGVKDIDIPKDDFQAARVKFQRSIKQYEQYKQKLNDSSADPQKMAELRYQIRQYSITIKKQLKYMMATMEIKNKQLQKLQSKGKKKQQDISKLKQQIHYKQLVILNCQRAYGLLFAGQDKQNPSAGAKAVTLQALLKQHQVPLLDDDDSQGDSLILQRIKAVDDYIQDQLDQIIDGIMQLNKHAYLISQALDDTHKKILMNVKIMDKNLKDVDNSNAKLKKYLKHCRRSYCLLDVILVLLLLVLVYLGYKQLTS